MKYNFDLTFDDDNVPCFEFPDHIKEDEIDNFIEAHIKYFQEYRLNIKKQIYYKPINYRILLAGILMLTTGHYLYKFDYGLWHWVIIIGVWMLFHKLVDK